MKNYNFRIEVSNFCNLKCPHCARTSLEGVYELNSKHVSLKELKTWFPIYFLIENKVTVMFSGLVAEPTLNPEFLEIVKYFSHYCSIQIDSNGSTNNTLWWKSLGEYNVHCVFSPDSLKENNNYYRINSKTNKVIENMKSFISGGGKASWKYIPFKHNEDEIDDQKKYAKKIKANFRVVQPGDFNPDQNIQPSTHFPDAKKLVGSRTIGQTPKHYCKLLGDINEKLIEISPDGVIYPCCYVGRYFFSVYANFFKNNISSPVIDNNKFSDLRYKLFALNIVPLIESQGGIKSLSLNYNTIEQILNTDFFKFSLEKSWEENNEFCTKHCGSREYVFSET